MKHVIFRNASMIFSLAFYAAPCMTVIIDTELNSTTYALLAIYTLMMIKYLEK